MLSILGRNMEFADLMRAAVGLVCGAAGIAVTICAFYGWGRLTRRITGLRCGTWPVSTALGLASVLFLGGVLNLFRMAYPAMLAAIVIAGLTLAVLAKWQDGAGPPRIKDQQVRRYAMLWSIGAVALTGFTVITQLEPSIYNAGDDFQHFFGHAVRMVQTGTLYGSPLNALGGEVLGGQAFLQGFIVGFFPLRFINGADAVFCFFLCLALAGGVAFGRPSLGLAALIGTFAVFVIDPQYVNVSSLFSMAAMVSALMILNVDPREGSGSTSPLWRRASVPALFYAGVIVLKNTGIVFVGLQFAITTAASLLERRKDWRATLAYAGWIAIWTGIFLSPWLLLYAPYYYVGLTHPIGAPSTPVPDVRDANNLFSLFSPANSFFGAPELAYTCLAAGLIVCALWAAMRARRDLENRRPLVELASASAAAVATYLFWMLLGPNLQESFNTLRYSIPVLIGAVSVALPLWASLCARRNNAVCIAVAAVLVVLFAVPARHRVANLINNRSALAFLQYWGSTTINSSRQYMDLVLRSEAAADIRHVQEMIPIGEPLLVWTGLPFLLDYRRNMVIDINVAGVSQAWGRISPARYVLWQYQGFGIASPALYRYEIAKYGRRTGTVDARALDIFLWLQHVAPDSKIIATQDGVILFQTNETALPAPN